jgi:hypothetical protein
MEGILDLSRWDEFVLRYHRSVNRQDDIGEVGFTHSTHVLDVKLPSGSALVLVKPQVSPVQLEVKLAVGGSAIRWTGRTADVTPASTASRSQCDNDTRSGG